MEISEILAGVELSEQQEKSLESFFKGYSEGLINKVRQEYIEGKGDLIERSVAEKAYTLAMSDAEKAFNMFAEDAECAFGLAMKDAENAFNLAMEDQDADKSVIKAKYTEAMATAMQDIYATVAERAKKDFLESADYKAFEKVKEAIIPVAISESQHASLAKLKEMENKNAMLENEKATLNREKAIASLLTDIPAQYVEAVKNFVSKATSEEEVYRHFNTIVELLSEGITPKAKLTSDKTPNEDPKKVSSKYVRRTQTAEGDQTKKGSAIFESTSVTDKPVKNKPTNYENALISLAFPQMI